MSLLDPMLTQICHHMGSLGHNELNQNSEFINLFRNKFMIKWETKLTSITRKHDYDLNFFFQIFSLMAPWISNLPFWMSNLTWFRNYKTNTCVSCLLSVRKGMFYFSTYLIVISYHKKATLLSVGSLRPDSHLSFFHLQMFVHTVCALLWFVVVAYQSRLLNWCYSSPLSSL